MNRNTWMILGATSVIAQEFAHVAAKNGHALILVGRDEQQLSNLAANFKLRYHVPCEQVVCDFSQDISSLLDYMKQHPAELNLYIGHSLMLKNDRLDVEQIAALIQTNIDSTIQIINCYLHKPQQQYQLLYISSVAALRGRAKNSLYGASKAAIEIYLQGLQQAAAKNQQITIARLGFIDTKLTFGEPSIFYAAPPQDCAQACWKALSTGKRVFYFPFFWRFIMLIIRILPFTLFKRLRV